MFQRYSLSNKDGHETATIFEDGEMFTANSSHPFWSNIVSNVRQGMPVAQFFNVAMMFYDTFKTVSEDFLYTDGKLFYKNAPLPPSFENFIIEHKGNVEELLPFVRNFTKINECWKPQNITNFHSLYKRGDVQLTDGGDVVLKANVTTRDIEDFFFPSEGGLRVNRAYISDENINCVEISRNNTHTATNITNSCLRTRVIEKNFQGKKFFALNPLMSTPANSLNGSACITVNNIPVSFNDYLLVENLNQATFEVFNTNTETQSDLETFNALFRFAQFSTSGSLYTSSHFHPQVASFFVTIKPEDVITVPADISGAFLVKKFTATNPSTSLQELKGATEVSNDNIHSPSIPTDEEVEQYYHMLTN